jgi:hypothetical protein
MLQLLAVVLFIILPTLIVWRFYRKPVIGDISMLFNGAIAGVTGGMIGATVSSFIYGVNAYLIIGYAYWLFFMVPFAIVFTLIISFIQRLHFDANLPLRVIVGTLLGLCIAMLWILMIKSQSNMQGAIWFRNGVIAMFIFTGMISGILTREKM